MTNINKLYFIPLILVACLFSCCINSKEEKQVIIAEPIKELFSIATFINPISKNSSNDDFIRNLNSTIVNNNKGGSATVFVVEDSLEKGKKPLFNPDMDYNVILSREDLIATAKKSYLQNANEKCIDSVDFNKYFVFAVTHPPGVSASDEIFLDTLSNRPLTIKLTSVIYPKTKESMEYGQFWMTKMYKIERKQTKKVLIKFDESQDSVFLDITPKVKP